MAYQTRQRDPLLDANMQEAIEKRGRELIGLALLALALAIGAMLASYAPQDPSFFSATDAPVENLLGKLGASIAAPLFIVVGYGSWALAAVTLAWGVRLLFDLGAERALSRVIFAPVAMAAVAVFASSIAPAETWAHSFGLGGLFGDTVLGAALNILPISASFGVRLLSVPILFAALGLLFHVCGFTPQELSAAAAFPAGRRGADLCRPAARLRGRAERRRRRGPRHGREGRRDARPPGRGPRRGRDQRAL